MTSNEITFLGKPLTVQRVLDAYKATGLKPRAGKYLTDDGCACAIGAIAQAEGEGSDFPECNLWGFISGFDNDPAGSRDREQYQLGQQCRKAVGL